MKNLFSPITINSLTLKNRLLMSPMGLNFTQNGEINTRIIEFYKARAKGGVGLIDVGGGTVHELAAGRTLIGFDDDRFIDGLRQLTDAVHEYDTKIIAQLIHIGSNAHSSALGGKQPISSSPLPSRFGEIPHALSLEEIPVVQGHFVEAALRAQKAGFDGIDIISAAGYLMSQFLSPIRNMRQDRYGGSLENRMRFTLEIVDQVRTRVGKSFPIFFKMAANEFMEGGHGLKEGQIFARELENAGVDCILTAGGWHQTKVPQMPMMVPDGTWIYLARMLKEAVNIPVIAANQIRDPFMADQIIRDGIADMVGMGRPLLADPELPKKAKEGRFEDINNCIGCLQGCFGHTKPHQPLYCLVNPQCGKEFQIQVTPTSASKNISVIGGGPAGMMAAKTLASRGHKVCLYEQSGQLGGQLPLVAAPKDRRAFSLLEKYLITQVQKQGVEVILNKEISASQILAAAPDAVVLATGAQAWVPDITGVDLPHVHKAWDVLVDQVAVGKEVVILGGGATGCETALHLAEKGTLSPEALHFLFINRAEDTDTLRELAIRGVKKVTVVEMQPKIGQDIALATRWAILQDLRRLGVRFITEAKATRIEEHGVIIERDGKEECLSADSVVLALGAKAHNPLESELKDKVQELFVIGDAKKPRKVMEAVHEGFEIGISL